MSMDIQSWRQFDARNNPVGELESPAKYADYDLGLVWIMADEEAGFLAQVDRVCRRMVSRGIAVEVSQELREQAVAFAASAHNQGLTIASCWI